MNTVAKTLLETLEKAMPLLQEVSDAEASVKPGPGKWSKKEILGHLIDSAANNQQKFVRTMQASQHINFVGYVQDLWVEAQGYNTTKWSDLLSLWESYNRHLAHIMLHTAEAKLTNTISIDGSQPFTLSFIMTDYVEHLKHHLNQIFPEARFKSNFENIYNT